MKFWSKALLGIALVLALPLGATTVWGGDTLATRAQSARPQVESIDISGPCDEAEHANDPRCDGIDVPNASSSASPSPSNDPIDALGRDISGPCDEAEHVNDPRCTGADDDDRDDDNSGPGSSNSGSDNSGPGSDDSGHDGSDDDDDEAKEDDDDLDEIEDDDDDDGDDTDDSGSGSDNSGSGS